MLQDNINIEINTDKIKLPEDANLLILANMFKLEKNLREQINLMRKV